MKSKLLCLLQVTLFAIHSYGQSERDSVDRLDEVIFTATRNERALKNVAVPASVISQQTIARSGSLRLKDILQEQTGLFITSGFGSGVQLQGLNPDYTLILLDGEPLIGRTAGVFDLNRLTVGNIKKIEIIKGPSSSLYGSEAMAGVINIITDRSFSRKSSASFRYGTYNTIDVSSNNSFRIGKVGLGGFLNVYRTDGFSIRPNSVDRAKLPIWRITPQVQTQVPLGRKAELSISARYNYERIKNELSITNYGQVTTSVGREVNKDFNIAPVLTFRPSSFLKNSLRLYGSVFQSIQRLTSGDTAVYDDYFRQQFYRLENQIDYNGLKNFSMIGGVGYIRELCNSSRYNDKTDNKNNVVHYLFFQNEWTPKEGVSVIAGVRYDHNKLYASALSPKLAVLYTINERFKLKASAGKGFKAPDFRQLYLNFTNTAAGSYSVFGALEAQRMLEILDQQGHIKEFEPAYYLLKDLQPEFSWGYNGGFVAFPFEKLQWQMNFFRNDVENLIDSRQVATRNDYSQIFSYVNVKKAFTQGIETNITYPLKQFEFSAGYQLLLSGDKDEIAKVKQGAYYTRDANNFSRVLTMKDYRGLPNRSRHMANVKLFYESEAGKWFANSRFVYRSKWIVYDKDGNGIYNKQDGFADGFLSVNLSGGKEFANGIRLQAGCDNVLNYADERNLPNMPGRVFYLITSINFINKRKNNHEQ